MQPFRKIRRQKTQSGQMGLIALVVTIAIIAILAGIMYPKIAGRSEYDAAGDQVGAPSPIDDANDASCISYESQVADAVTMYRGDHSRPPESLQDLKPYGINDQIINTPYCNFQLPKYPPQPTTAQAAPISTPVPTYSVNYSGGSANSQQMRTVQPPPQYQQQVPQQEQTGGTAALPLRAGRSIPMDGGSSNINAQAGDDGTQ